MENQIQLNQLNSKSRNHVIRGSNFMNVYHYCSFDVFKKIVSGRVLRLSDISRSNDSMEINWITRHIKNTFIEVYNDEKIIYFKSSFPIELFVEMLEKCIMDFFDYERRIFDFFVFCFSENGDLLSQWRGYADDGRGVAIGFDMEVISKIINEIQSYAIKGNLIKFDKVVYKESDQRKLVKVSARKLIREIKDEINKFSESNHKDRAALERLDVKKFCLKPFNDAFLDLLNFSVFAKNDFFKEEAEWRICRYSKVNESINAISINDKIRISEVNYFNRNNEDIPYIDLLFDEMKSDLIKDVILGPKCKENIEDIVAYLKSNGIDCLVERSEGSYR